MNGKTDHNVKKKKNITTFEEHLKKRYGKMGTPKRDEFERNSKSFIIGEMVKEARLDADLTQDELKMNQLKNPELKKVISQELKMGGVISC